jgi:uncharacterized OB-fold protein
MEGASMKCRNCGTEIADKAIICYRCGTATVEQRVRPRASRPGKRSMIPSLLALIVLAVAGLYMASAAAGETPAYLGWILLVLALIAVVWRLVRR